MPDAMTHLTDRERQVLRLICKGRTNAAIAEELGISFWTAKWYVSELLSKTGVESREELAAAWRFEQSPRRRLARAITPLFSVAYLKPAAFAGVAAVAGVSALAIAGVLSGGHSVTIPGLARSASPAPSLPTAGATPPATATAGTYVRVWIPADGARLSESPAVLPLSSGPSGICAQVSTAGLASNFGAFRMFVDGLDVTQELAIFVAPAEEQAGTLCYQAPGPLGAGTHAASVTVAEQGSDVELEKRAWSFEIEIPASALGLYSEDYVRSFYPADGDVLSRQTLAAEADPSRKSVCALIDVHDLAKSPGDFRVTIDDVATALYWNAWETTEERGLFCFRPLEELSNGPHVATLSVVPNSVSSYAGGASTAAAERHEWMFEIVP